MADEIGGSHQAAEDVDVEEEEEEGEEEGDLHGAAQERPIALRPPPNHHATPRSLPPGWKDIMKKIMGHCHRQE